MKKLLILGAGIYQVPLIKQAKQRGLWITVASPNNKEPGMALADERWLIDTTDKKALLKQATQKKINAITTTGTDVAIPSLGYICENMGLPGISFETAQLCSDKILMKKRLAATGVPSAAFLLAQTLDEVKNAALKIGLPIVIKAPDSSGSRGITVVKSKDQIEEAFLKAKNTSKNKQVLVEELLTGVEFGAQVIVIEGKVVHCLCHNDTVTLPPVSVPIGHSCPSNLSTSTYQETVDVCASTVKALGIKNAICNADLISTSKGIHLLEIGARIGATGIPEIINLHYGLNLYDLALQIAFAEHPKIELKPAQASAVLIIQAPATGKLIYCRTPKHLYEKKGLISINFDYPEGSMVRRFCTGPDRIGDALVVSDTATAAEKLVEQVISSLDIKIKACN